MQQRQEQIAIDGPAASGKSSVARAVAQTLDGGYVSSGQTYRALALLALEQGLDPHHDAGAVVRLLPRTTMTYRPGSGVQFELLLNGEVVDDAALRRPEVAAGSSQIARLPEIRAWLRRRQRDTARFGLVVMEGRDIGTVIFPRARHKFFLTASPEERARRRLEQAGENLDGATLASVAAEIARRDETDSKRPVAPLRPAKDAIVLDTTGMTLEAVVGQVVATVRDRWQAEG